MAMTMEDAIVPVDTAEAQKERDLREAIQRRRATLRESLKLKPVESEDGQQTSMVWSTETSFTNTKSLLESLKERRLKRKGQLPPLEKSPLGVSTEGEAADSAPSPDQVKLRERLRQRMLRKQGEAKSSDGSLTTSVELDPPPQRKLRGLRDHPQMTRFDEILPDEPLATFHPERPSDGIEHVNKLKRKALYKTATMEEVKQKKEHVLDQEAYDFFTSEIENCAFPEVRPRLSVQPPVEGVEEPDEPDETDQDTSDVVALREQLLQQIQDEQGEAEVASEEDTPMIKAQSSDDYRDLLLPGYARYTPYRERLAREEKAFFTPSTVPASAEQKTPDSGPPHYAEDEGLYVGERPHVLWTNQVAMENRLLRREDEGVGWFGEDGLLLVQPNPLSLIRTRPSLLQYNPQKSVSFKHARYEVKNQKLIDKGSGESEYELKLELSSLHFHHHSLFSVEHVLASKLKQACRLLKKRRHARATDYYQEKLQGLRQAVVDLKLTLQSEEGNEETQALLLAYLREMKAVREKKREALAIDYDLLETILRTWHNLKALRDNQGYSSTTAWITIKRLLTNAVDEETSLRREVDDELCELRDLHELEGRERMENYQRELAEWKVYEKARRRAVREATRLQQQQQEEVTGEPEQSLVGGSQASLKDPMASVPPERPRPAPPPVFDDEQLRVELLDYYRHQHKPPGEPTLTPEFSHNHALSQEVPRIEQHRREDTVRAKLYIRVLFNNQLVSQTKECTLNSDFSCEISEKFALKIVQWPESIKLEIFESGLLSSTLISEVYIPIPDPLLTADSVTGHEVYQFSSTRKAEYGHTAVGSGQVHPVLTEEGVLLTSGVVRVGAYWGVDESGKSLCPPGLSQPAAFSSDAISSLGMTGIADLQEVKRWIERSRLDPNDPRNAELLHLLESIPSSSEETSYFRLVEVDKALRFVEDKDFEENRRFVMLKSRQDGHPGLKNKSVPIDSQWISESEWRAVTNYKPYADYDIPLLLFGDFHGSRKAEQNKFLLDVRERVLSKARSGKEDLTLEDVVHAFSVPDISSMRKVVADLIAPRRPLNPVRATRRKPKRLNAHVSSARIVVRVVRALNIPIRASQQNTNVLAHPLSSTSPRFSLAPASQPRESLVTTARPSGTLPSGLELADSTFSPQELKVVCPYVEIGFRGSVMRTATAYGPQPFWNEEISVPFEPPDNDFSPAALQRITDVLHISLFDEVVTDILQDDRQRMTNIHHRIEKKWLGSFTFPFSTLHQRERIEGMFQVEVPVVLLGYSREADQVLEMSTHTHLQLFVTLEPSLSVLPPLKDKFESEEHPRLLSRSRSWIRKLKKQFPKRNYIATALDVGGSHVFVTRFVKAQNPPVEITPPHEQNLALSDMERLARYVSLIPFLPDTLAFSGECDIWNTSDQFLHMLAGDEEEHALLLCNYFLHCGLEAWVLVGHAIPEGSTTYVLTYHPEYSGEGFRKYLLWNPNTGHHYLHDEPYCPLKSVGCVINQHNVWANVQDQDEPAKIRYDFSNSKQWQALFPSDMPPLDSVQQELDYSETDTGRVRELQEKLERAIHDHITSLRERFITRWNRHCSQLLHALLPRLEEGPSFSTPLHNELDEIMASYKVTGFPIHSPYVDAQHLMGTIERTGIHLCEDPKVEFALAVYVHSYPNDVVSIWTYVASLIPH